MGREGRRGQGERVILALTGRRQRPVTNERPCLSLGARLSECKDRKQVVCLQSAVDSDEDCPDTAGDREAGADHRRTDFPAVGIPLAPTHRLKDNRVGDTTDPQRPSLLRAPLCTQEHPLLPTGFFPPNHHMSLNSPLNLPQEAPSLT